MYDAQSSNRHDFLSVKNHSPTNLIGFSIFIPGGFCQCMYNEPFTVDPTLLYNPRANQLPNFSGTGPIGGTDGSAQFACFEYVAVSMTSTEFFMYAKCLEIILPIT